ncbi:hypothetical protein STEG23_019478, partial [Scotinomys teguina]
KSTHHTNKVTNTLSWDECAVPVEDLKAWRESDEISFLTDSTERSLCLKLATKKLICGLVNLSVCQSEQQRKLAEHLWRMISVKRNTWRALSVVIGDCRKKGNFEYCQDSYSAATEGEVLKTVSPYARDLETFSLSLKLSFIVLISIYCCKPTSRKCEIGVVRSPDIWEVKRIEAGSEKKVTKKHDNAEDVKKDLGRHEYKRENSIVPKQILKASSVVDYEGSYGGRSGIDGMDIGMSWTQEDDRVMKSLADCGLEHSRLVGK